MVYLGLDPGANGGVVVLNHSGTVVHLYLTHGDSPVDLVNLLEQVSVPARACLERVWTTGPGHRGDFAFGRSFGHLEAALAAARIPCELVLPKKWQAEFGISYPPGTSSSAKKTLTKATAQLLFPGTAITHATADALLLAEYCRRVNWRLYGENEEAGAPSSQAQRPGRPQGRATRQGAQGHASQVPASAAAPGHGTGPAHEAGRPLRVDRRRARGHEQRARG